MKEIILSNSSKVAIVDDENCKKVCNSTWHEKNGYAYASIKGKKVGMHRIIADCPIDMVVHHINHNKLDNRSSNLMNCKSGQNTQLNNGYYTTGNHKSLNYRLYYNCWYRRAFSYRHYILKERMSISFYSSFSYVFLVGDYLLKGYPLKVKRSY